MTPQAVRARVNSFFSCSVVSLVVKAEMSLPAAFRSARRFATSPVISESVISVSSLSGPKS